ncbi:MAG TPA: hypothetical protein VJ943_09825, partial [Desulfotignum sp.]|nr:hypothetical protein [Desulfotignum sp.]
IEPAPGIFCAGDPGGPPAHCSVHHLAETSILLLLPDLINSLLLTDVILFPITRLRIYTDIEHDQSVTVKKRKLLFLMIRFNRSIIMKTSKKRSGYLSAGIFILLPVLFALITGCMGAYGKLTSNPDILHQYQTSTLPETFQYYFSGRSNLPDAVVGIDKTYQFQGRFWTKMITVDQVYEKIGKLSTSYPDSNRMQAADILDNKGNRIGMWFSYQHYAPVKINPKTGMVEIYPETSIGKSRR